MEWSLKVGGWMVSQIPLAHFNLNEECLESTTDLSNAVKSE